LAEGRAKKVKLFVDSSGWIALFDRSDQYQQQAATAFRQLQGQNVTLFTSDYVFDEAITFIRHHTTHLNAVQFGYWLLQARNVNLLRLDEAAWRAAWQMFQAYDDRRWAFTDCTSFILMRQQKLFQAFTFDHHFAQAGFQLWPGL
jgi:uncharacterized protein